MRHSLFAGILAVTLVVLAPAYAADPQKFTSEESATKFCKQGNVVWFNPGTKIYFEGGSRFYGHTKDGGFTWVMQADFLTRRLRFWPACGAFNETAR